MQLVLEKNPYIVLSDWSHHWEVLCRPSRVNFVQIHSLAGTVGSSTSGSVGPARWSCLWETLCQGHGCSVPVGAAKSLQLAWRTVRLLCAPELAKCPRMGKAKVING